MDLTATLKSINTTLAKENNMLTMTSDFGLRTRANYCLKSEYNTPALCENKGHILHEALKKKLHRAKPPPLLME